MTQLAIILSQLTGRKLPSGLHFAACSLVVDPPSACTYFVAIALSCLV